MPRERIPRACLFGLCLVPLAVSLAVDDKKIKVSFAVISMLALTFSALPWKSSFDKMRISALIDVYVLPLLMLTGISWLSAVTTHHALVLLSICGLVVSRLDIVIGDSTFGVWETTLLEKFDLKQIHDGVLHMVKHKFIGYRKLLDESRRTGKTPKELCEEADERPHPSVIELAYVYILSPYVVLLPQILVGIVVFALRRTLALTGGKSVLKFAGFLIVLASAITALAIGEVK